MLSVSVSFVAENDDNENQAVLFFTFSTEVLHLLPQNFGYRRRSQLAGSQANILCENQKKITLHSLPFLYILLCTGLAHAAQS